MRVLLAALTLLTPLAAHAHPPPTLTDQQRTFIEAQIVAQYGPLEKLRLRPLAQGGGSTWVQALSRPRLVPGKRAVYLLLDGERGSTPCVVAAYVREGHTLVPVGTWPAGVCG